MDLQFKKEGTVWVAEFEATSDFNLHLERVENGSVSVAQSGIQGGEYDVAFRKNMYEVKNFDYDFGALVYPKYIKVTSGSEVIKGVVNFNVGGGSGSSSGGETGWIFLSLNNEVENPNGDILTALAALFLTPGALSENSAITTLVTSRCGIVSCSAAHYQNLLNELNGSNAIYCGAIKKGARFVVQELNMDLPINSYEDIIEFIINVTSLSGITVTREDVLNNVVECSVDEWMSEIAAS